MTRLAIELVPKTAHFTNARSALTRAQWNRVKDATAARSGHACEICGPAERVEAHEVWEYREPVAPAVAGVMFLVRTIALCPRCHRAVHWGYTSGTEFMADTRRHILRINDWTNEQLEEHIRLAWREWARLSRSQWTLDISCLDSWLVKPRRGPAKTKLADLSQGGPEGSVSET
jgi:hypothetical protein